MSDLPVNPAINNARSPDTPITITHYAPEKHTDALAALYIESVGKLGAPHYNSREIEIWQTWAHNTSTVANTLKQGETWVAFYNGAIAGFAQRSPANQINMLYSHPNCARLGIATQLLEFLINNAKHDGISELTAKASRVSRALFEKHGFRCNGEEWVERRDVKIQRFLMMRRL